MSTRPDAVPVEELADFLETNGLCPISMAPMPSGHLQVPASIDGVPGRLIVDTGASHTVLDRASVERFGLTVAAGGGQAGGLGTTTQQVSTVVVQDLSLGDIALGSLPLAVIDLSHVNAMLQGAGCEAVDGVIGGDFLRAREAIIDYARSTMYIRT